jgi:hypothetical protein
MNLDRKWLVVLAFAVALGASASRAAAQDYVTSLSLSATVNSAGSLQRNVGAVSATRLGLGQYELIFNQNILACGWEATIGSPAASGTEPTGEIALVNRAGNANGLFLTTFDSNGNPADRGFHASVECS